MKIRIAVTSALLATTVFAGGCSDTVAESEASNEPLLEASGPMLEEGGLVVYVVVDQLRDDLLDRYDTVFTGGLARLKEEGLRYVNSTFDHAQTSTSPGHGTAATGTHPHRHGLVGNSWRERLDDGSWKSVYALRDLSAPIVGFPEMEGRGPANLDRDGLPDWILAADPDARVVSLSGKDRAAIAMAGYGEGIVYWLNEERGRFLTSTAYRDEDLDWVTEFNESWMSRTQTDSIWNSIVPEWAESLSRPDTFPYEGDGTNTYLPHRAFVEVDAPSEEALNEWWARTPFPDNATVALALRAIQELELGQRGSRDYLALALSQVDRVGHDYGPLSREQLDNLIRLDRSLEALMELLDAEVGPDRWMMAFTADHGVLELPEAREELGLFGRRITPEEDATLLARAEAAAAAAGEDELDRARAAAEAALELDWIEDAFAWEDLVNGQPADTLQALFLHSYHPERVLGPLGHLGVGIRTVEGAYSGRYPTGTGHGSPYYYDRNVPFILLGPGIAPGVKAERVSVVDLAPTVAALLGVPYPHDLDGRTVLGGGPMD